MRAFDDLLSGVYSTTVTDAAVLIREVRVRIGVLTRPVTVRIYYHGRRAEPFSFEVSELLRTMHTPHPLDVTRFAPNEAEALRRAVRMLTAGYEDAVRRGEIPDDSWLVAGDVH